MTYADSTGAAGVFLLLLAFILAGTGKINGKGKFYFLLNTIGAGMACYASWLIEYLPFVVLEGAWTIVSIAGLVRSIIQKNPA